MITKTSLHRANTILFVIVGFSAMFLLVMKALKLPVVSDESHTPLRYITFSVWEIMMYPDNWPNNHILNSILTKLAVTLLGNHQFVIRLPNLLFFVVYVWAIYHINSQIIGIKSIFFIPAALFFLCNPYVFDFFALCRGYGISLALTGFSTGMFISAVSGNRSDHLLISFFSAMAASYAHFTVLLFWSAVTLLSLVFLLTNCQISHKRRILYGIVIFSATTLYLLLISTPLSKIHRTDELQFWSSQGFYKETIYPFIEYSRSGAELLVNPSSHMIAILIFCVLVCNGMYVIYLLLKGKLKEDHFAHKVLAVLLLLLITVWINLFQVNFLGTPNLHGRTAMFLYPLFISNFAGFLGWVDKIKLRITKVGIAMMLAFICIFHMADRFTFTWVRDWWHDAETLQVIEYLRNQNQGKPLTLQTTWLTYNSFDYYVRTNRAPWINLSPYNQAIDTLCGADYYYIFVSDTVSLGKNFIPVQKFGVDRVLLQHK